MIIIVKYFFIKKQIYYYNINNIWSQKFLEFKLIDANLK